MKKEDMIRMKTEKKERLLKILDICSFCTALASTIVIALEVKKNKKLTGADAVNLFLNGWLFGVLSRR